MKIVIDANVLFSILIKSGKTEELLIFNNFELFAPEYLFAEFEKYKTLIFEKTQRDIEYFEVFLEVMKRKINIVPNNEINSFIEIAKEISPDIKDTDYFAVALLLECPIWSNDKLLKSQDIVKIYNNEDLIKRIKDI